MEPCSIRVHTPLLALPIPLPAKSKYPPLDPYARIAFAEVAELDLRHIKSYLPAGDFPQLAQKILFCIDLARWSQATAREALARNLETELRRRQGKKPKRYRQKL